MNDITWLCSVTASNSSSERGGISLRVSLAYVNFFNLNSMADLRLKASTKHVSCNAVEFPTLCTCDDKAISCYECDNTSYIIGSIL